MADIPIPPPITQRIFPTKCGSGVKGARPRVRDNKSGVTKSRLQKGIHSFSFVIVVGQGTISPVVLSAGICALTACR